MIPKEVSVLMSSPLLGDAVGGILDAWLCNQMPKYHMTFGNLAMTNFKNMVETSAIQKAC